MAHIFSLNRSAGGVPKLPTREAAVTVEGLEGDRQAHRRFHGGPTRALCLFSLEHILALQAEGHPIYPGSTGENVTIAGLEWASLLPGTRLRLGETVEIEISSYTVPCDQIAASFAEARFVRIAQKLHPGWSRLYAAVTRAGTLRVGDAVVPLPPAG